MDEADIIVWHHGLDLEIIIGRYHNEERLPGRDHATDRVDRKLLDGSVNGGGQHLQFGPLLGLDEVLGKA